jgi:hypothetical protein
MNLPGFTAEIAAANPLRDIYRASFGEPLENAIVPQFCYCDCRLYQTCIPSVWGYLCIYRQFCLPRGSCPPGYCGT